MLLATTKQSSMSTTPAGSGASAARFRQDDAANAAPAPAASNGTAAAALAAAPLESTPVAMPSWAWPDDLPSTGFEDTEFPPTAASVGKEDDSITWRSAAELACTGAGPAVLFTESGACPSEVLQGKTANCYFIAALSLLAQRPELLASLFRPPAQYARGEPTHCRFFRGGRWEVQTVDDRLPARATRPAAAEEAAEEGAEEGAAGVDGGGPGVEFVFGRCREASTLWVALIEKAYAKLYGSYEALRGGNISEALCDLSGCGVCDYPLDRAELQA